MENKKFSFSDGLIIAATPALIYIFVYAFERGYCSYFNLPKGIIDINISNLLVVGGQITGTLITLFLVFSALPAKGTKIIYRTLLFSSIFGTVAFILFHSEAHFLIKTLFIIIFFVFFLSELVIPLFKYRGSWIDRWEKGLEESDKRETPIVQKSIVGRMIQKLIQEGFNAKWIMRIYWIIFGGLFISYYSGVLNAKTQNEFLVEVNKPNVIYLRKWADHLVGIKFDKDSNALTNQVYLLPIKTDKLIKIINIQIDKIKPFDDLNEKDSVTNKIEADSTVIKN